MSSGSQIRIAESLWGVYSTITSLRKRKRAGCTDRRDSPDATASDHSGHLLCVALTMRQFLCTARLDAVHTLLLKVMLSFDSCLAPSRTITSEQLAADENRDDDTEEDDDRVCLEPILRVLPLSALTARCRETIGFTARKSDSKDTHLPGQRSSENDLSSSRLVLALLGRLVGDACALLGADERSSAVTTCNDIQVSSYGTAIGVTVLAAVSGSHSGSTKSAQHNNGMRSVMSSLNFNTHASASLTHSLIRRIGVISKYLLGTRSNIDRGPKRSPVKVWDLRKVGCLIGAQQGLTISLHAALGSCAKGNNSLSMPKSQSDRDHLDSSNAGRPRPFHAEAEVKVLMSSALAMLAVADYLSTSPSFSQMLSPSNPRLAAQPPSVTSTALKALKCTFQTLDLILSLSETVTRDRFEFAKSCFHSTIKAALNFSHTLHLGESRTPTTHAPCQPQERGALTPLRSPLLAMVDVAKMWSMILSFLVSFAKNLPSSLQSGAQSLVPQKV